MFMGYIDHRDNEAGRPAELQITNAALGTKKALNKQTWDAKIFVE